MKEFLLKVTTWWKAKWGRITTLVGGLLTAVEGFDITPIKEPLEKLLTDRGVSALTLLLFGVSFYRHQQIANRVKKLESQGGQLPK